MNFKHSPSGFIRHICYLGDVLKEKKWEEKKNDLYVIVESYALYEAPEIPKERFWKRISKYCIKHFNTNTHFNYEIFKIYNKYLNLYKNNNNKFTNENIVVCV
jgi:hypothetical protein